MTLLPAEMAQHTVEGLLTEHGRPPNWIYWLILGGILAGLSALPLVKADVTVRAAGIVRPAMERTDLKVAISGRIARVLARDNDRVTDGQPLLEVATPDLDERLGRNRALQHEKSATLADLSALTTLPDWKRADERTVASTLTNFRTTALQREHAQFLAQLAAARLAVAKAQTTHLRLAALHAQGIATDQDHDNARYDFDRAQADLDLLQRQTLAGWQERLRQETTALDQLRSEEKQLVEERAFAIVRAPVTGTVQGLVGLTAGTYLVAGQSVGAISPDDRLVVEAYASPRDIGLIRVGQTARLQIDAFPYTECGLLDAVVERLSADTTIVGSQVVYKAILQPRQLTLRLPNGASGTLVKGMTLSARLVVTRRTLLQLMSQSIHGWLDPAASGN